VKQVIQNYKTGELRVLEVPIPNVKSGGVLVRNSNSLVSLGTEKMVIDLAKKSIIGKAKARPDLVKQVMSKIKTEGLAEAYRQAMNRLDSPVPLGYSCAGTVIEVGDQVDEFNVGDRVACFGDKYASHAEIVYVPQNLCVKVPDDVDLESAAFTALGAIALHGIRTAELTMGEKVVVIGLGLLGQIAVQLLKAFGCSVFGVDILPAKTSLALELGADDVAVANENDVIRKVSSFSNGRGADVILIMASTSENTPIELASELCRDRGRIVALGLVGLNIPRRMFYYKELNMIVPRSAGPGVYDHVYEEKGVDYPLPYVRWTERRNMQYFLELVSQRRVNLDRIITHRFKIDDAEKAYEMITGNTSEMYMGVLISYDGAENASAKIDLKRAFDAGKPKAERGAVNIGLIGAGLFANTTLLPCLRKISDVNLKGVATATGASGRHVGDKFGFEYCTSDYEQILDDPSIDCVMIATRHNLHAKLVVQALKRGKHVFVEKPLAVNRSELEEIIVTWKDNHGGLMVGFNRRFSPFSSKAREWIDQVSEPMVVNCRVNAGPVPKESWVHDPVEGGGRIIGEICHFVDLIQYLTDSLPVRVYAESVSGSSESYANAENVVVSIKLQNGSVATISYTANGDKGFPRERIEAFGAGSVCVIDNFKTSTFTRDGKTKRKRSLNVDRGHQDELSAFFSAIRNGTDMPVDLTEYVFTTLTTFSIVESLKSGTPEEICLPMGIVR
jgi:predicted dehydrogenase/threonine dehydrogenase-like Zn-dependent dehydrogenase